MHKNLTSEIPMATIVMVSYNSALYVREAVESCLASSFTSFELIIGDDCSTDSSWTIISEYKDPRIVAYRNEQNLGEYTNRNKAVEMAQGKYLIFIDGDDMIYPHGLDFMVKMLEAFPECGMALMWWNQNDIFYPVVLTSEQFYIGEYFGRGVLGSAFSNVCFRTAVLKKVGGLSAKYRNGDDYIRYKIAAQYPAVLINDGLTWWRETPGQASQQFINTNNYLIEAFSLKFEFLRAQECPLSAADKVLAEVNLRKVLANLALKKMVTGKLSDALQLLKRFSVPFTYLLPPVATFTRKNPFQGFSPANPSRLPLRRNPYSTGDLKNDLVRT